MINLAELSYGIRKGHPTAESEKYVIKYSRFVTEIQLEYILHATEIKMANKKRSIIDSIGYAIAKRHGVKFLTGDEGFRNMPNVEFVK